MITILQLVSLKHLFKSEEAFNEFVNKVKTKINSSSVVLMSLDESVICGMIATAKTKDLMSDM